MVSEYPRKSGVAGSQGPVARSTRRSKAALVTPWISRILPLPAPTPSMSMRTGADGTMTAPGGVAGEQTRIPRFGQTGTLSFLNTVGEFNFSLSPPCGCHSPPLASSPAAALVATPPVPPVRDGCGRLSPTTCRASYSPLQPHLLLIQKSHSAMLPVTGSDDPPGGFLFPEWVAFFTGIRNLRTLAVMRCCPICDSVSRPKLARNPRDGTPMIDELTSELRAGTFRSR